MVQDWCTLGHLEVTRNQNNTFWRGASSTQALQSSDRESLVKHKLIINNHKLFRETSHREQATQKQKQHTLNFFMDLLELLNTDYKVYLKYLKSYRLQIPQSSLKDSKDRHLCCIRISDTQGESENLSLELWEFSNKTLHRSEGQFFFQVYLLPLLLYLLRLPSLFCIPFGELGRLTLIPQAEDDAGHRSITPTSNWTLYNLEAILTFSLYLTILFYNINFKTSHCGICFTFDTEPCNFF